MKSISILLVFVCSTTVMLSQETTDVAQPTAVSRFVRYGAFVGGMLGLHNADFTKMSDSGFCCPDKFGSQTAAGFSIGGLFEYPISGQFIATARASFWFQNPTFSQTQTTLFNNPVDNSAQTGTFNYVVKPSLAAASIDVMGGYRIGDYLSVYAGPRVNYLLQGKFDQLETVTTPGYVFTDNLQTERNKQTALAIPALNSLNLALMLGVGYEFALNQNRSMFFVPELFGSLGIGSLSSGLKGAGQTWTMNAVILNLALKFSPRDEIIKQDSVIKIIESPCDDCKTRLVKGGDCVPVKICPEPRVLRKNTKSGECECMLLDNIVKVDAVTGTMDGKAVVLGSGNGKQPLVVESYKRVTFKPLLPYIFFKEAKDEFAVTYSQTNGEQTAVSEVEKAKVGVNLTENLYKNIINIIGLRMLKNPSAIVRLRGTTDGIESDSAGNLALRRVNSIRKRLVQVFNIDASRILIDSSRKGLPEKKSMVNGQSDHPAAREENRRVEFYSDDMAILAPVEIEDEKLLLSPENLDYNITVVSRDEPKQATIKLKASTTSGGDVLLGRETADLNTSSPEKIILRFETKKFESNAAKGLKSIFMDQKDSKLTTTEQPLPFSNADETVIPVKYVTVDAKAKSGMKDTLVSVYELILFDFDSDKLSPMNERIVEMLKKQINEGSVVTIEGNTDNSGTKEINKKLSERRAGAVASLLPVEVRKEVIANADERPMTGVRNDTPYGRNFNRNVIVTVKTPVRK
ncbi:MAG: OmpA family protein [Candidatus Kapabacteria bacterium]|nr:OmpA family protein [Candidatus Kapabacteria bacterium]